MKHEEFIKAIKEVSEQFHVVKTEGVTEVHWIYGGFDLYEDSGLQTTQFNRTPETTVKPKGPFSKSKTKEPVINSPKYHVIAKISETQNHVLYIDISADKLPEKMRRRVLPVITEYAVTPNESRNDRPESLGVIVKSGDELRKERQKERVEKMDTPSKGGN